MAQYAFGSGGLWGVRTDTTGTPVKFATLQDVSLDVSFTEKELRGKSSFPVAIARAAGKLTCKAKFAKVNGLVYSSLFFGVSLSAGMILVADSEAGAVPAVSGPYTITVSNHTTFDSDLGVSWTTSLLPLTKVANTETPTTGQYKVDTATGIYTFAAADTLKAVLISYTYTAASTGQQMTITNPLMGQPPTFMAVFQAPYAGNQMIVKLPKCYSNKLSFATKLEDFMIPEMDFSAGDDGSGNVMYVYTLE